MSTPEIQPNRPAEALSHCTASFLGSIAFCTANDNASNEAGDIGSPPLAVDALCRIDQTYYTAHIDVNGSKNGAHAVSISSISHVRGTSAHALIRIREYEW